MDRIYIIQKLIARINARVYLEIGVASGNCFLKINAPVKLGVDPEFTIPTTKKFNKIIENTKNKSNQYYKMISNEFFRKETELLTEQGLDIVFLDGLHSYEQSLTDLNNSLKYLNQNGFIVLHDCNPTSEAMAKPAKCKNWSGLWCGDVWKTIAHVRAKREDLQVFVLDCDFGVGVIFRAQPEKMLNFSLQQLNELSYKDLEKNREEILNLKEPKYFKKFLKTNHK